VNHDKHTRPFMLGVVVLLALAHVAMASPSGPVVLVDFVNGSGYSGGSSYYVGPYNLLLNGDPILGTCISVNQHVDNGETWQAHETPVVDFADPVPYQEAQWLNLQFGILSQTHWVAIQQAIWDIFAPNTFTDSATLAYLGQAQNPSNYQLAGYSFSVLVPIPGTQNPQSAGLPQAFLVNVVPRADLAPAPEPASLSLITPLALLGGILLMRRARGRKAGMRES
jgi:hypothetical protein